MERAFQFFIVDAVCGHVGREYAVIKSFAITERNQQEAAAICRTLPRVKHHFKYAIRNVRQVSLEEYVIQYTKNAFDPYLNSSNIQEQSRIADSLNMVPMETLGKKENYKRTSKVGYKRYFNNYYLTSASNFDARELDCIA